MTPVREVTTPEVILAMGALRRAEEMSQQSLERDSAHKSLALIGLRNSLFLAKASELTELMESATSLAPVLDYLPNNPTEEKTDFRRLQQVNLQLVKNLCHGKSWTAGQLWTFGGILCSLNFHTMVLLSKTFTPERSIQERQCDDDAEMLIVVGGLLHMWRSISHQLHNHSGWLLRSPGHARVEAFLPLAPFAIPEPKIEREAMAPFWTFQFDGAPQAFEMVKDKAQATLDAVMPVLLQRGFDEEVKIQGWPWTLVPDGLLDHCFKDGKIPDLAMPQTLEEIRKRERGVFAEVDAIDLAAGLIHLHIGLGHRLEVKTDTDLGRQILKDIGSGNRYFELSMEVTYRKEITPALSPDFIGISKIDKKDFRVTLSTLERGSTGRETLIHQLRLRLQAAQQKYPGFVPEVRVDASMVHVGFKAEQRQIDLGAPTSGALLLNQDGAWDLWLEALAAPGLKSTVEL